ncbi:hypothetical protein BDY21DRAFT_388768, partial [Lineolata rhizophorae]
GNGPAALILSYILHGHIPFYDARTPHPDPLVHARLSARPNLLDLARTAAELDAHIASSLRYFSAQALPVNALFDSLLRPNADTAAHGDWDGADEGRDSADGANAAPRSCIEWRYDPHMKVQHIVLGSAPRAGGQWAERDPHALTTTMPLTKDGEDVTADDIGADAIGTLSYADMLSLPGYTFAQHHRRTHGGASPPPFLRPPRAAVADYYAAYPAAAGIADAERVGQTAAGVRRLPASGRPGFYVASHRIVAGSLVLASGTFSRAIPPPAMLAPLLQQPQPRAPAPGALHDRDPEEALLVIGSGFSAADAILAARPPTRRIVHVFRWDRTGERPSPLKGCHSQAYPEYAGIYRLMKAAAAQQQQQQQQQARPQQPPLSSSPFLTRRDWVATYTGLPNAAVESVIWDEDDARAQRDDDGNDNGDAHCCRRPRHRRHRAAAGPATVTLCLENGARAAFRVGALAHAVGRRGSLSYLAPELRREDDGLISGRALRARVVAASAAAGGRPDLEVAPGVFAIGSLLGDSLVRHAFGGCAVVAGRVLERERGEGGSG